LVKGSTFYYVYDKANRLIQVKNSINQEIASYTYNSQGIRLTKKVGTTTFTCGVSVYSKKLPSFNLCFEQSEGNGT